MVDRMRCIFSNNIGKWIFCKLLFFFLDFNIDDTAISRANTELSAIWLLCEDMIWGIRLYLMRNAVSYFAYQICYL